MSSLCPGCLQLAATISFIAAGEETDITTEKSFIHTFSGQTQDPCKLCVLIASKVVTTYGNKLEVRPMWRDRNELDINLGLQSRSRGRDLYAIAVSPLRRAFKNVGGLGTRHTSVEFQVYCKWDSPAASISGLSHRYRFHHTGSSDSMVILQTWLANCHFSHDQCRVGDFSDEVLDDDPKLPTQVIDVGPKDGTLAPRLFISNGVGGRWIALSHCWGTELLRPLSTSKQNYSQHQKCIPLSSLPKTFHDAVLVARALDIRYLWIDSLCIIQDDENDKRRELPTMGRVYQHAHLTILAAEAMNCSDGLFFDAGNVSCDLVKHAREEGDWTTVETESGTIHHEGFTSVLCCVELPFTHSGKTLSSFFVTFVSDAEAEFNGIPEHFPRFPPLFGRAWVTQEWTLSRRSILFLRDGIVWSCKEYCENERGIRLSLRRPKLDDWQALVKEYSSGSLTFEGDKLKAIQGIATSLRTKRTDEYFAGLWSSDFPDNLLWRVRWDKKASKELLHIPSWSWARHLGLIGFQLHGRARFGKSAEADMLDVAEISGISHSGALMLRTYYGCVHSIAEYDYHRSRSGSYKTFLKFGFRGYSSCRQVVPLKESMFAQLEQGGLDRKGLSIILHEDGPIGWGDWDLGSIPDEPVAWVALKLERGCLQQYGCTDALHVIFVRSEPFSGSGYRVERVGMGVVGLKEELSQLERTYLEIV